MRNKSSLLIAVVAIIMVCVFAVAFVGCSEKGVAQADEPTPVVYTFVDDESGTTWTVTIVDETTCVMSDGTTETNLTYTIVDGILTLTNPETSESVSFVVNADNTLTPNVTEETPEPGTDITIEAEVDEEKLTQQVTQIISDFLGNYLQESFVAQIISWLVDVGALGALVAIFLKYRKYKHTTIEDITKLAGQTIKEQLGSNFKDMDGNTAKLIGEMFVAIGTLAAKMDNLIQAFALSQDKSAEGKIAMLQIVQGTTEDKNLNNKIEEMKTEITTTEEAIQEVEEKVQGEYKDISW